MFLILFRNILCPQQTFPNLRSPRNMCPQQCVLVCHYLYRFYSVLRYWQTRTHCCGHIVADTNVSPFARARNICCGHKFCVRDTKMFLILFRNILCPQQMFPSLRAQGNVMSNNVSATMCPRLPVPLRYWQTRTHCCRHKCFPVCPRAQHLLRTQILCPILCPGHRKCF